MPTPDQLVAEAMTQSGFTKVDEAGNAEPVQGQATATPAATAAAAATVTPVAADGKTIQVEKPGVVETKIETKPFDEGAWLNEKFGGKFKSSDEVLNKLKDFDDLSTKLTSAEAKAKDFEMKSAQSPFVNDYVKGLNDFISKGGDPYIYQKVAGLDLDKLSEKDALVLKYRFQHNMKKEDAEFKVQRKYMLGSDVDETDPDVREARIDLALEGAEAKKFLTQYKADQLKVPGNPQDQLKEQQEQHVLQVKQRVESWKPHQQNLLKDLGKVTIPLDDKGEQTLVFDVPKETLSQIENHWGKVLEGADLKPDAEGLTLAKQILLREVYFTHFNDMVKSLIGAVHKKNIAEQHNPSALKEGQQSAAAATEDRDKSMAAFIAKQQGIKNFA